MFPYSQYHQRPKSPSEIQQGQIAREAKELKESLANMTPDERTSFWEDIEGMGPRRSEQSATRRPDDPKRKGAGYLMLKAFVRTVFLFTTREKALQQCKKMMHEYLHLTEGLSHEAGRLSVNVPPMKGVDEDMRDWSFFMILEHNTIVHRAITANVVQLARNETLSGAAVIDPKKDVMPSTSADASQVELFRKSVMNHIDTVRLLGNLRGSKTTLHPVFGPFDAHRWNCMFALHLKLHLPQAKYVVTKAKERCPGDSGMM